MRRPVLTLIATALALSPATTANAGAHGTVDPAIMQPPLNPTFTWTCSRSGPGFICDGVRHDSWTAEPTDLPCSAGTIYSTATDDRRLRRWSDAQGRALHSHSVAQIDETLSLDPQLNGITARADGHFSERFLYAVPGELSSRTVIQSGIDVTVTMPGNGLVMHDVGVKAFDIEDNLLWAHGQHDLFPSFEAGFAKVCDALQG
jgi:hypothetical protein